MHLFRGMRRVSCLDALYGGDAPWFLWAPRLKSSTPAAVQTLIWEENKSVTP